MTEKTACRTPAKDRDGVTHIPSWKFDLLRRALLELLSEGDVPFAQLARKTGSKLTTEQKAQLGSLSWHVTTVKLELEVRGEVGRRKGASPQIVTLKRPSGLAKRTI